MKRLAFVWLQFVVAVADNGALVADCAQPQFEIDAESKLQTNTSFVWSYWASETEPQPLNYFMETWQKNLNVDPANFHTITPATASYYLSSCELPRKWPIMSKPSQADAVRAALLARYGGIWLDKATIVFPKAGELWEGISSGQYTTCACTDDLKKNTPWAYVEAYFLMTRSKNPRFITWRDNIVSVMHDKASLSGNMKDKLFQGIDFHGPDANPKLTEYQDYLSLANSMWYAMAKKDPSLQKEMQTKWKQLSAFDECMAAHLAIGGAKELLEQPSSGELLMGNGHIAKFPGTMKLVKAFKQKYGDSPSREQVLGDKTALALLLRSAGLS